jgi:hypothetical protein
MKFSTIGKIGGMLALTLGLAGCFDMTMDLKVTSDTTATATITQTMGSDIYAMVKGAGDQGNNGDKFCGKEGETLTENADGSATCVSVSEGEFDKLSFADSGDDSKPTFTVVSPGVVRVSVKTKGMAGDLGKEQDEQTAAMMKQMFEGHFLTIRFGGVEVTDTNMTVTEDGTYAETKVPFLDLINGTAQLPEELYAVVRTN